MEALACPITQAARAVTAPRTADHNTTAKCHLMTEGHLWAFSGHVCLPGGKQIVGTQEPFITSSQLLLVVFKPATILAVLATKQGQHILPVNLPKSNFLAVDVT